MDTQSGMDICAHDIAHYRNQLFKSTVLSTKLKDFILKKKKEDDKNIKEERVKKRKNLVINDEEESKAISLSDIRCEVFSGHSSEATQKDLTFRNSTIFSAKENVFRNIKTPNLSDFS